MYIHALHVLTLVTIRREKKVSRETDNMIMLKEKSTMVKERRNSATTLVNLLHIIKGSMSGKGKLVLFSRIFIKKSCQIC